MHKAVIRAALLLAAAATLSTTAVAQGAQQMPPPVKAWLAEQAAECRAARGRFSVSPDFLTTADFNGDGVPDYVVSVGDLDCETASGMGPFAYGSAGPSNDFLMSGPRGHRRIEGFRGTVGRGNIQRRGNRDVIVAERGAPQPHLPTKAVWGWNGTTMALLELRNARGELVDENGRLLRPPAATAAATNASNPEERAIRAALAAHYSTYTPVNRRMSDAELKAWEDRQINFSQGLLALLAKAEAKAERDGEAMTTYLNHDPFCQCQDSTLGTRHLVRSIRIDGPRATVDLDVQNQMFEFPERNPQRWDSVPLRVILLKDARGKWTADDFVGDSGTLRQEINDYLSGRQR